MQCAPACFDNYQLCYLYTVIFILQVYPANAYCNEYAVKRQVLLPCESSDNAATGAGEGFAARKQYHDIQREYNHYKYESIHGNQPCALKKYACCYQYLN